MSRAQRLKERRKRHRIITVIVACAVALVGGGVAYAAVSQVDRLFVCVDKEGHAVRGWWAYERSCRANEQQVSVDVRGVNPAPTTTTRPATTTTRPTTTTTQPQGTIIPAGGPCPRSTSSSMYEGNRLTVAQAAQALYAAGFRQLSEIRAFVGISSAEASLCVRVWHWHPEFGAGQADVGPWQISTHFWPQFPQSQTLDPLGAARAVRTIYTTPGESLNTWDTWSKGSRPAQSQQPTAAAVCAAVPATGC